MLATAWVALTYWLTKSIKRVLFYGGGGEENVWHILCNSPVVSRGHLPCSCVCCKLQKMFSTILPCPPPVSSVSAHSLLLQSFQSGRDTAGVRPAREKMEKRRAAARGVPDWDYSELHARE